MRYADAHAQDQLDALMLRSGRPTRSPGWGMLKAVRSGTFKSRREESVTITAGSTSVCRDYWLASERPELFMPADKRDTRTIDEHRGNLERTRRDLERGRTTARARTATPRSGVLPPRGGSTLRLPHSAPGRRPLRLPR